MSAGPHFLQTGRKESFPASPQLLLVTSNPWLIEASASLFKWPSPGVYPSSQDIYVKAFFSLHMSASKFLLIKVPVLLG